MIPEFALRLICGLATVWCVAPRRQITSGFFRIQMLLVLGLSVLATVTSNQLRGTLFSAADLLPSFGFGIGLCLAFLSFAGSMAWTLERRRGGTVFAVLILLLATAGVLLISYSSTSRSVVPNLLSAMNSLSAAWILGATTAAMLLGHWYLTATGMSLQPLMNYTRLFGGTVTLRIVVVLALHAVASGSPAGNWTLMALRWGGLLGPLIMAGLTLRILRYRNTQSATGVLYAATILVFMGEMAASLLSVERVN
ncbi:hypothetical protein SH661x_000870 [Planctomicrobium sp. SH661]|uniref:hypothetical protein n=1 Tax=Planctomicrobium sp. SH661 TaxID=3448124 RepID=UPI003F5BC112